MLHSAGKFWVTDVGTEAQRSSATFSASAHRQQGTEAAFYAKTNDSCKRPPLLANLCYFVSSMCSLFNSFRKIYVFKDTETHYTRRNILYLDSLMLNWVTTSRLHSRMKVGHFRWGLNTNTLVGGGSDAVLTL